MAGTMQPFLLERFFAKHEFSAPHLACCSDCEPMTMQEVLALASPEALQQWNNLRLGYTESQGLPELRSAVAQQYFTGIQADEIVILAPEEGVYLTMRALLSAGDHVIVTFPGYQSLYEVANSIGCRVSHWEPDIREAEASVKFDVQKLAGLMRDDTKMVVVNFPHNPTGTTLSPADWQQLVELCSTRNCWLFSDEMYRMLELDPQARLPCAADCYPRAISLGGCSKALSLPGLRLGWVACRDASLIKRVLELKDYTTICSAAPSEVLALIAVKASPTITNRNVELVRANVKLVQQLVDEFPTLLAWAPPTAGSTAFPRLTTGEDIEAFCDRLVAAKGVLLLPSTVYGHAPSIAAGHFRIGLGRRNLGTCLEHLREFLRDLSAK